MVQKTKKIETPHFGTRLELFTYDYLISNRVINHKQDHHHYKHENSH